MLETWQVNEQGLEVAAQILERFSNGSEPLSEIAADFGLTAEEARVLMIIVEHGGIISTDFPEPTE